MESVAIIEESVYLVCSYSLSLSLGSLLLVAEEHWNLKLCQVASSTRV